jgi:hypothetical protein
MGGGGGEAGALDALASGDVGVPAVPLPAGTASADALFDNARSASGAASAAQDKCLNA